MNDWNRQDDQSWRTDSGYAGTEGYTDQDPLEAIYALNIGDFVTESFISDDLMEKIHHTVGSDPDRLIRQLEELVQIYSVDRTLSILGFEPGKGFILYDSIAATLCELFHASACHLFQVARTETGDNTLTLIGTSAAITQQTRWNLQIPVSQPTTLTRIFRNLATLTTDDIRGQVDWHPLNALGQNDTKAFIGTPIREGSKALGVLTVEYDEPKAVIPELVELAEATSRFFVTAIRLQQLLAEAEGHIQRQNGSIQDLQNLRAQITQSIADLGIHQQEFAEALAAAADARHAFSRGHSKQVAHIAKALAESLELNEKSVDLIYYAGLLGNIGKIRVPKEILEKKDSLTSNEWDDMRNHLNVGVNLLVQINFLSEVVPYVRHQKERWDGKGSPDKLKGRSIPLGARILGLADAYYAMTNERPYRDATMSHAEAIAQLRQEAGVKWDPALVDALANIPEAELA